ncbi:hypothetical protein VOLCADRAFT_98134 [Volvox carteri f. nagariensis]|uniref:Protein transport protein SEC23 n=1 Tax=Volvox carteri f. nagariensis TaxID=3068 RepID=D8UEJ2_VOLCA|nr:uncharacterized protein VOLCADRAFT_98134 [Volvox carteri f. nagariensis]EFJ41892.1 hypothetical protein VOLCADRAFT_98134 [Volvox carteri f. nagariensis]|eukprot:XP_002957090.1 hypothetical protein VOLCADRAFT_98134 [Volvox carteri f. nagariensis]
MSPDIPGSRSVKTINRSGWVEDHVLTLVSSCVVNQRGFANTCGVPLGAHMDFQPPAVLGLPRIGPNRPPLRCNGCSAFLNVYCKTNLPKGVWKCNMCGTVNIHKDRMGEATEVSAFPELCSEAVEYVAPLPLSHPISLPSSPSSPPSSPPNPNQTRPAPHLVFAVDTSLESRDLQAVREALLDNLRNPSLDPTTLVSLVTFDGCVAVHNLGVQRCSHVLPASAGGAVPLSLDLQSAVQQLLDRHCVATAARRAGAAGATAAAAVAGGGVLVSEAGFCASHLPGVLSGLRTVQSDVPVRARASRVIVLAGGPPTRGPGAVPLELLDQAVSEKGRGAENRLMAAALDVGAALGDMAAKIGVAVDIFTSVPTGINARLLTAISHGCGGEFMPQNTHTLPHVEVAVEVEVEVEVEAGRCASLRLEVTRDLTEVPSLLLQVALHFVDPVARCRVVRVVTRRIAVVESRVEFLRGVNPVAAAALLGKRAALDAKKAGAFRDARKAEEARYLLAAQLALVATRCGQEGQASRGVLGFGGRKSWQWPAELMPLAYALYHMQRGPLLGPPAPPPPGTFPAAAHSHLHSLWDSDARLANLNALLRTAWGDAYRAMSPKLYVVLPSSGGGGGGNRASAPAQTPQLVALPCVSLAAVMARTAPLLLDVGTAVLVSPTEEPGHVHGDADGDGGGSGGLTPALLAAAMAAVAASSSSATAAMGPQGAVAAASAAAVSRFPVPSVVFTPGAQAGGGALAKRLIPVHLDSYPDQCMQHPQLQQLGLAVAAQLSKQLTEGAAATAAAAAAGLPPAQAKQAAAAAASFVEWCRTVQVRPFPVQ